jgi:hypothetical protein
MFLKVSKGDKVPDKTLPTTSRGSRQGESLGSWWYAWRRLQRQLNNGLFQANLCHSRTAQDLFLEAGKLLERVIAACLGRHLSRTGPDLSEAQYGFREGRGTIAGSVVAMEGVTLAISLDVANAFNSLPSDGIMEALKRHQVPPHLRAVLGAYLWDRCITIPSRYGVTERRAMHQGVPQGSVLGPTLWNLGYDPVLRRGLPVGVAPVCYANDTLVLAWGDDWREAEARAHRGTERAVRRVHALGLSVALEKTEAMWFHGPRSRPSHLELEIEGVHVRVGPRMKYLWVILDSRWRFIAHFEAVASRVEGVASALGRLLPNLRGPGDRVRRLYLGVAQSVALYGSPI